MIPGGWRLATCSYAEYEPGMGVPVRTSVGPHPAYPDIAWIGALAPFGIFGKMDDRPIDEQRAAYWSRLHQQAAVIETRLDQLSTAYPGRPLVLLCWCTRPPAGRGVTVAEWVSTCHRRWAAAWFGEHHGLTVPELGVSGLEDNASVLDFPVPGHTAIPGDAGSTVSGASGADQHHPRGGHS
ncbi:hypothetical protein [Kribbella italica]|uniref:Uncharacterized protein n=1 Tax=Kribbella italica TaxID=1540520 RepID=A0A7W9J3C5_9ACTN|nr:hypothetical protein [Kribbella italica]MBB5834385.1 hypothetical protein [Kribbella italica]